MLARMHVHTHTNWTYMGLIMAEIDIGGSGRNMKDLWFQGPKYFRIPLGDSYVALTTRRAGQGRQLHGKSYLPLDHKTA